MEMRKMEDMGAMIGIFVIIVVLIIGAFYFAGQRMEKSKEFKKDIGKALATTTSANDDITALQKDAASMNFDNLGTGVDQL